MIYLVLPVYNEAANIAKVLGRLKRALSGRDYRIIAVNDGSTDASLQLLRRQSQVQIKSYRVNMNVGAVFATGIAAVLEKAKNDADVMVIMESDQTSAVGLIPAMVREIEINGQDVVIASRYQPVGSYRHFPLMREIYSRGANRLLRWRFPIQGVCDYTIFFRAYRVSLLRRAVKYFGRFGLIQSKGFVANAELLVKLSLLTRHIKEIPFVYDYAKKVGKSKINVLRTINEYFVLIGYLNRIFAKWQKL